MLAILYCESDKPRLLELDERRFREEDRIAVRNAVLGIPEKCPSRLPALMLTNLEKASDEVDVCDDADRRLALGLRADAGPPDDFQEQLQKLVEADLGEADHSLLIGESFPVGERVPVSSQQARRLRELLLEAKPGPVDPEDRLRTISPATRLCALELAGTTWYFMPPGNPVDFVLPDTARAEFERIMRTEFGLE